MDFRDKDIRRKTLGRKGEDIACDLLSGMGFEILERNWRSSHKEIDIICRDGADLRFVEVKSRVAPVSAAPEENVGFRKQQKLVRAAQLYLHSDTKKEKISDLEIDFDIISVIFEGEKTDITFFPKAYIPFYL